MLLLATTVRTSIAVLIHRCGIAGSASARVHVDRALSTAWTHAMANRFDKGTAVPRASSLRLLVRICQANMPSPSAIQTGRQARRASALGRTWPTANNSSTGPKIGR